MRTTVEFDEDTAKAIEGLRRERGIGVSEAVNELVRRGLVPREDVRPFHQRTR
ncbi:MAG: ribbon-helix-helix protein, CopG family, partial [Acidimicrobiales bacterium]